MTLGIFVNWLPAGAARLHHLLLRRRLHDVAEALDAAEHRHRRRGRRVPADDRLGAVTGSISLESVLLFLIIFLWTPPHFWALALFKSGDYGAAGIPMMPNVAGEASTKRQIFAYALLVAAVGVLPWAFGFTSDVYGIAAAALGIGFVWCAWKVLVMPEADRAMRPAKALFGYSLLYLFAIFAIYLGDSVVARMLGI
jgi:protoheme IX farnesyltransferase